MNVIFLDFDGVLNTIHDGLSKLEEKIKILADICHTYNAKVVIEAGSKLAIDEETLEIDKDVIWIINIFELFKKYDIECIGRTPEVRKYESENIYKGMWKEDEIRLYLMRHPEIEHYCVIDDDDLGVMYHNSDLNKVREHLVRTDYYLEDNYEKEGLQEYHKEEVGKKLELDNEVRKLLIKYRKYEPSN